VKQGQCSAEVAIEFQIPRALVEYYIGRPVEARRFGAGEERGDGSWAADGDRSCLGQREVLREAREGGLRVAEVVQKDKDADYDAGGRRDDIES